MKTSHFLKLLLLSLLWGSSNLFIRLIAPVIGISITVGGRMLIASIVLLLIAGYSKKLPDLKTRWKDYLFLGVFNIAVPFALVTYTVVHLNITLSSVLNATTSLFTLMASRIFLKERLTINKMAGIFISITGVVIFIGWSPVTVDGSFWIAILAGIVGAISYGSSSVYAKVKFNNTHPLQIASGQILIGAIIMLPLVYINYQPVLFSSSILLPLIFLALFNTAMGYVLYFRLLRDAGSLNTSLVTIFTPVFSIAWAVVFLNEPVTASMLIGLALIVFGIMLVISWIKLGIPGQIFITRTFKKLRCLYIKSIR